MIDGRRILFDNGISHKIVSAGFCHSYISTPSTALLVINVFGRSTIERGWDDDRIYGKFKAEENFISSVGHRYTLSALTIMLGL